ncbi:thioesterase family protein, partial [Pseudomonas aeruginosa]|nr:thioesterase family protein [Pseudomonas aeruginosa]
MSAVLTAEQAMNLVGERFVSHMPFNGAFGVEL